MAILASLITTIGVRLLGRWKGAIATALAIGAYAVLIGPGASIWRAAIMAWIGLPGFQIGRRQEGKGPSSDPQTNQTLAGYLLLHTNRNGWIHISTDGKKMWVEGNRK